MNKPTLGAKIAVLRRQHGMTQLELAQQMGVTDKAVSKWERDLSCPDIASLPRLAQIFGVTLDELMQVKVQADPPPHPTPIRFYMDLALKGVALAMGVAVAVLSALGQADVPSALSMLGMGLACLAIVQLDKG